MSIASNHYVKYTARLDAINREIRENPGQIIDEIESNFRCSIEDAARLSCRTRRNLILLAGPSSSGKTTTSHLLTEFFRELGKTAHVISLDDFFFGRDQSPVFPDGRPDYDALRALDVPRIQQCLKSLVQEGGCEMPIFNFTTGYPESFTRTVSIEQDDVVIVEGLHALNPCLTEMIPPDRFLRLYISVKQGVSDSDGEIIRARQMRLIRRLVRDYYYRASSPENTMRLWKDVCDGEDRYIQPFKRQADLTINSMHLYEPCVFRVLALPLMRMLPENAELAGLAEQLSRFEPLAPEMVPASSLLQEFIKI